MWNSLSLLWMFNYDQSLCVAKQLKSFVKTHGLDGGWGLNMFVIRLRSSLTGLVIKQFNQEMQMRKSPHTPPLVNVQQWQQNKKQTKNTVSVDFSTDKYSMEWTQFRCLYHPVIAVLTTVSIATVIVSPAITAAIRTPLIATYSHAVSENIKPLANVHIHVLMT